MYAYTFHSFLIQWKIDITFVCYIRISWYISNE